MNKKIIPRKDHDVYFIRRPDDIKSGMIRRFVHESLSDLHPLFSGTTIVDIQSLVFDRHQWLMATVMENEVMAEYKIIHNDPVLFTNTAIAARDKNFTANGVNTIDDEIIGYDAEKNEPVSLPLDSTETAAAHCFADTLSRLPVRYSVFKKKTHKRLIAAALAGLAVMTLLFSAFSASRRSHNLAASSAGADIPVEEIQKYFLMPNATAILANIAEHVVQTEGTIARWQYNENTDPCISIQCNDIPVVTAYAIFADLPYAAPRDIKDVQYTDGAPVFTVRANANRTDYSPPPSVPFPPQNLTAAITAELSALLRDQDIAIVSETLPSALGGNHFYTLAYTAQDWNLIKSFDIIEYICDKYNLRVTALDVAISGDNSSFNAACSLSRVEKPAAPFPYLGDEKYAIPAAFGYQPPRPPAPPPAPVEKKPLEPIAAHTPPLIGSIKDSGGKTIYFRDTDGKIKTRNEL
jgi:hypothetical protein